MHTNPTLSFLTDEGERTRQEEIEREKCQEKKKKSFWFDKKEKNGKIIFIVLLLSKKNG